MVIDYPRRNSSNEILRVPISPEGYENDLMAGGPAPNVRGCWDSNYSKPISVIITISGVGFCTDRWSYLGGHRCVVLGNTDNLNINKTWEREINCDGSIDGAYGGSADFEYRGTSRYDCDGVLNFTRTYNFYISFGYANPWNYCDAGSTHWPVYIYTTLSNPTYRSAIFCGGVPTGDSQCPAQPGDSITVENQLDSCPGFWVDDTFWHKWDDVGGIKGTGGQVTWTIPEN